MKSMENAQYTHYFPNKIARIILIALEEILGRNGLNAILNTSAQPELIHSFPPSNMEKEFPFENISKLIIALEEVYGTLGGRGLAIRAGRSSFKYGLREFGKDLGLTDQTFKLQPLNTKIRNGARIMADLLNGSSDQRVELGEDLEYFYWHIHSCPFCWQRRASIPVCYLVVGALQEGLYWVTSGKFFSVEEILCVARGDPTCTIRIGKEPME